MVGDPGQLVCEPLNFWSRIGHHSVNVFQNGLYFLLIPRTSHRVEIGKQMVHVPGDTVEFSLCLCDQCIRAVCDASQLSGDFIQAGRFL
jgi:hypothetical protein